MNARSQAVRLVVSLDLTILNLRSWLRWQRPVTFGTAARLVEEKTEQTEARVCAIFRMMAEINAAAGLPGEQFREAARETADHGMSTRERAGRLGLSVLRQELDAVTARLDAQDEAWSAWRSVREGRPGRAARPVRHLSVVGSNASTRNTAS